MRKAMIGASLMIGLASGAVAADLPSTKAAPYIPAPIAAYDWTGFYVGVEGGVTFPRIHGPFVTANGGAPYRSTNTSGIFGGLVGYNQQIGAVVLGIEGNLDGLAGGKRTVGALDGAANAYHVTTSSTYNGDIRGRIGVAIDRSLLYATGGAAFGNVNSSYSGLALPTPAAFNSQRAGFTVGFGWDYAFTQNLLGRIEYRYTDLGRASYVSAPNAFRDSTHLEASSVLLGVIYKFGAPTQPVGAKY